MENSQGIRAKHVNISDFADELYDIWRDDQAELEKPDDPDAYQHWLDVAAEREAENGQ